MFSILKFVKGFAFWKGEVLGKLLYYLIIIVACLGVFWKLFLAPSSVDKSKQEAETITNITHEQQQDDDVFIGFKLWCFKFGVAVK